MLNAVWGSTAAYIGTILILVVAIASLFSVMLGYTRIPYAAAQDGLFFRVFGREHPTANFPHVSLLILGAVSVVFAATLSLGDSIKAIITMRVFTQFIAQAAGLMVLRRRVGAGQMPWRMWLYPLPVLATIAIWLWLFWSADTTRQIVGIVAPVVGTFVYMVIARRDRQWPFRPLENLT
jgi:amino acid transporter